METATQKAPQSAIPHLPQEIQAGAAAHTEEAATVFTMVLYITTQLQMQETDRTDKL